jgi:uncharacterized circularly permuted ATP-grasp superfamily protein
MAMANGSAEWTGPWVSERLTERQTAERVEIVEPQILKVFRKDKPAFLVATMSEPRVEVESLRHLLDGSHNISFVANIMRESIWTNSAIDFAARKGAAFGGMGDLLSATDSMPVVSNFIRKEFAFVERGLRQHTRVQSFERTYDRVYIVKRSPLPDLTVALLHEYDLLADHVRTARERYGHFGVILKTRPNGEVTENAYEAARFMGVEILKWGEFLGRLNRR